MWRAGSRSSENSDPELDAGLKNPPPPMPLPASLPSLRRWEPQPLEPSLSKRTAFPSPPRPRLLEAPSLRLWPLLRPRSLLRVTSRRTGPPNSTSRRPPQVTRPMMTCSPLTLALPASRLRSPTPQPVPMPWLEVISRASPSAPPAWTGLWLARMSTLCAKDRSGSRFPAKCSTVNPLIWVLITRGQLIHPALSRCPAQLSKLQLPTAALPLSNSHKEKKYARRFSQTV